MKNLHVLVAALASALILAGAAWTQTAPALPAFEVASVKPSPPDPPDRAAVGLHIDGAQVHVEDLALKDYIRIAYQLKYYQVLGPDWLSSQKFDVAAKLPEGSSSEQVPQMLQTLLVTRFQLISHTERKSMPVYSLVQAPGGAKLTAAAPAAAAVPGDVNVDASGSERGVSLHLSNGAYFGLTLTDGLEARNITMPVFADALARFMSRPVVDDTHLSGTYDFTLPLAPDDYRSLLMQSAITAGVALPPEAVAMAQNAADTSLFASLAAHGLKLQATSARLEVRVVDHIDKAPLGN